MMSDAFTVEYTMHEKRGRSGRRQLRKGEKPAETELPPGRVPRVARLMALAIRCQDLVHGGEVNDYADMARLGHLSRARMSQIINLLNLAPDIQEDILLMPPVQAGRDPVGEVQLRPITLVPNWQEQRRRWWRLYRPESAQEIG